MRLRRETREDPEINLISMIDVLLVLLIFFMISTTFEQDAHIRVRLPQASDVPLPGATHPRVVITITANGSYLVDGVRLADSDRATLSAALARAAGAARGPLTIRADGRTTHQSVVTAMDVAGRLGFAQLDIATTHEEAAR